MREKIKIEYEQIKEMRDNIDAPVDTMGCHLFCDDKLDKNISNFHIIVGAFLSSQTQLFESSYPSKQFSLYFIKNFINSL